MTEEQSARIQNYMPVALRYAADYARRQGSSGDDREDIQGEALLVLTECAVAYDRADEDRGFAAYVRQALFNHFRDANRGLSRDAMGHVGRWEPDFGEENKLTAQVGDEVPQDYQYESLSDEDTLFEEADESMLGEDEGPEEATRVLERDEQIERCLAGLLPDERRVIEMDFGLGDFHGTELTMEQIAEATGISRRSVFNIRDRALRKMKARLAV